LVAQRENTTFKISTSAGQHYALRLHRPGYHQRPQLEAELKWLQYLFEQGIAVPAPVASLEGCLIEQVEDYYVSVLQWLNGLPMGQTGTPLELKQGEQVFYTLGQGMAEMHAASDRWDGAS
jgi:Ser/Thr protein kinase RdoA (MazF antagonist)